MSDTAFGDVPLLDPVTGRFPDAFAPPSVAADASTATDAATNAASSASSASSSSTSASNAKAAAEAARDIALAQTFAGSAITSGTNANTITTPGVQYVSGGWATTALNWPVASLDGILESFNRGSTSYVTQMFTPLSSTNRVIYVRRCINGTWASWRALSSQRIDQTAGRAIYTWDDVNNREQLTYGDTGMRDITSLFSDLSQGSVYLGRTGNMVSLLLSGILFSDTPTEEHSYTALIPVGFRPGTIQRLAIATSATTFGSWSRTRLAT
jgi:hypothetical protein